MTVDTFELLARYNATANESMNSILAKIPERDWDKDLGGYFSSLRSLTGHIYTVDVHWMVRFSGRRKFQTIQGAPFSSPPSFGHPPFGKFSEYLALRQDLDAKIQDFVKELTPEDLASELTFRNSRGDELTKHFGGLALHWFNHQTHHRGQISMLLDQMKIDNDYSNITALL